MAGEILKAGSANGRLAQGNGGLLSIGQQQGGLLIAKTHFSIHDRQRRALGIIVIPPNFSKLSSDPARRLALARLVITCGSAVLKNFVTICKVLLALFKPT